MIEPASPLPPDGTPPPAVSLVLVTGLSGAGRGTVGKVLEDLGWSVTDNLPPALVPELVDITASAAAAAVVDGPRPQLAIVVDVRSSSFEEEFAAMRQGLIERGIVPRLLFLDASDAVLIQRFEHVRRRHPLQGDGTLSEAIGMERAILGPILQDADLVIDTSTLAVARLRDSIENAFAPNDYQAINATVVSFGFKRGVPLDADMIVDVRFLPNPHWIPELRLKSGLDRPVIDYVFGHPEAELFLDRYLTSLELVMSGYRREGKRYMTIGVGCTGGKHRSVALAEALTRRLREEDGVAARVVHRDLGKE